MNEGRPGGQVRMVNLETTMLYWIKRIAVLTVALFGFVVLAAWLVLSSSILAKTRGDLTAQILTRELGQAVEITGGVRVDLGSVLHVTADGLELPSQTMTDVTLAVIGQLEFDVDLRDLLGGRINLRALRAGDASVKLLVTEDGTSSWSMAKAEPAGDVAPAQSALPARSKSKDKSIVDFLADHRIQFSNSGVSYSDARNGLELDLLLTSLEISKKDKAAAVVLQGEGTLNGQELTLDGNFPQERPFKVTAAFSQISVALDGTPDLGGYDIGYSTAISMDIAELGQLQDVLKLEKYVSGTGHVSAVFKSLEGSARIDDLDVLIELDGGQSLEVKGDLGKLGDPSDITLDTNIRLYTADNKPAPATRRRDLKLIGVDMQLIAQPNGIPKRGMVIETNGFVLDTSGEGPPPISFSEISRSSDGKLRVGKVVLRIGPPEAHFLVLEGSVENALRLDKIDIKGTLEVPTASIFAPSLLQTSDVLGQISGGFRLSGNIDELTLSNLKTETQGSDLWNLDVSGSVQNLLKVDDVVLNIVANIPSGAKFLSALKLEPVETGPVKVTTKMSSDGTAWMSDVDIAVAESEISFSLDLDIDDPNPVVRGQVESDLIKITHLRDIIATAIQLAKLNDLEQAASQGTAPPDSSVESEDGKKTEPLLLKKPGQADPDSSGNSNGAALADTDSSQQPGPFRNVTLHPLGRSILLSGLDLGISIDLRKIEGDKGSSSLKSNLEMKDQKARLGPLKFEYDGAHFDISGSMDLNENPDTLKISGSAGGWNFGNIMHELHFKKGASGILNADFDLSGNYASVKDFLTSVSGNATVSMRNGSIDSQLLDLAGLGIIPWLFSKDRGSVATIVCARAPLYLSNGRISTKRTVVETDQVQIVVLGNVDLKNKTLDIKGQPRRIGKPLSRSPWPFTAVGSISDPKIKVKDGPKRLRRSDGASTMPERRKPCVPDILQLK